MPRSEYTLTHSNHYDIDDLMCQEPGNGQYNHPSSHGFCVRGFYRVRSTASDRIVGIDI